MHAPIISCPPETPLAEVARMMAANRIHAVIVDGGDPEGGGWAVLSDRDLLAALADFPERSGIPAGSLAGSEAVGVGFDDSLERAGQLMLEHEVDHLIVLDSKGEPVGVLSTLDVARAVSGFSGAGALRLVAAHDGTPSGDDAVALAAALAAPGTDTTAVTVVPYSSEAGEERRARSWDELRDRMRRRGEELLAKRAVPLFEPDRVSTRVILDDSPARALSMLCESASPDLLILGSSQRSAAGKVLVGTTAERVLSGAPCSIAVAPRGYAEGDAAGITRIGVAFDGSRHSRRAVTNAARLADHLGASLRVEAIVEPIGPMDLEIARMAIDALSGEELADSRADRLRAEAQEALDTAGEGAREATIAVRHGDAASCLIEASLGPLDLLVVGSRGYGTLRRTLLGSVSAALIRNAGCPVIVAAGR
jgi:nucleotide-binding universal stress UspA family protein